MRKTAWFRFRLGNLELTKIQNLTIQSRLFDSDVFLTDMCFQRFGDLFTYLDETLKKMAPNATVKYAPMIAPGYQAWINSQICRDAFVEITREIESRNHVQFDSYLPYRNRWLADNVHMYDDKAITFFTDIFKQI